MRPQPPQYPSTTRRGFSTSQSRLLLTKSTICATLDSNKRFSRIKFRKTLTCHNGHHLPQNKRSPRHQPSTYRLWHANRNRWNTTIDVRHSSQEKKFVHPPRRVGGVRLMGIVMIMPRTLYAQKAHYKKRLFGYDGAFCRNIICRCVFKTYAV